MKLNEFTNLIDLKDEEIPKYLRKLGKKGYCVLWYHEAWKDAITFTIYKTKIEAEIKIKETIKEGSPFNKTKIIKL